MLGVEYAYGTRPKHNTVFSSVLRCGPIPGPQIATSQARRRTVGDREEGRKSSKPFSDPSGRTRKCLGEAETGRPAQPEGVAQVDGVKLLTRRRTADRSSSQG